MKCLRNISIICSSIIFFGCGEGVPSFPTPEIFWHSNQTTTGVFIRDYFRSHSYQKVVHIHFAGNDLGQYQSFERDPTWIDSAPFERALQEKGFTYPEAARDFYRGSLGIFTGYASQKVLFTALYRHHAFVRAAEAFSKLFECEDHQSARLKKILLIGSGGSHGADALDRFSQALGKSCGKKIDFALIGDAIQQPGPFPKEMFSNLAPGGACIHFYQTRLNQFVHGGRIEECFNIHISESPHSGPHGLSQAPTRFLMNHLDELIDGENGGDSKGSSTDNRMGKDQSLDRHRLQSILANLDFQRGNLFVDSVLQKQNPSMALK